VVRARGAFLIFDETYELFTYGGHTHTSAIRWFEELSETVAVVNSMSKTFAMTGWRLGYAVAHAGIISPPSEDPEPLHHEPELDLAGGGRGGPGLR